VLDEIEVFARLEFDYLELTMDPPMAHHSTLAQAKTAIIKALKTNAMDLVCHLPTFVTTADLTESLRLASVREMHQSLAVAADLGAGKVVLHPSPAGGMGAFVLDVVKGYAFEFLGEMEDAARRLGVTICLENMFPRNGLGVEADDFKELFNAFPTLKMTLDTGHANIDDRRGRRLKTLVEQFGPTIGHIHVSDNRGRLDDHLAVGQGTINFGGLVRRLKALGYDDTVTLEVFDANRQMLVASREQIRALFDNAS
jgi:sugar phosphate isomerase/epimerase